MTSIFDQYEQATHGITPLRQEMVNIKEYSCLTLYYIILIYSFIFKAKDSIAQGMNFHNRIHFTGILSILN